MSYSVNLLTTALDCDALLAMAAKDLDDLLFRQTSQQRLKASYAGTATEIQAELAGINAQVAALQPVVATLPAGDARDANEARLKRLELRQYLLGQRQADYGTVAIIEREHDLARIAAEIGECQAFIAALEARKAAL